LTLQSLKLKSNGKVSHITSNFYAEWRARIGLVRSLREEYLVPPERLLQAAWFHQRLLRDKLKTIDGIPVQVLHPGFWNHEAGPDFRGAVLQLGTESPCSGDVEVDLHSSGWHGHKHDQNPAFKNVLLHVVWEGDGQTNLPTLALRSLLDSPLHELALWLHSDSARAYPDALLGQCCAPLRDLPAERLAELLHQAALVRLHSKASRFQARARQAGWEQALWEGVFRALGYKHNIWPMQRLAELRAQLCKAQSTPLALQARLLGLSGLLPADLTRVQESTDGYVRRLWDFWWRDREGLADYVLPRMVWRLNGLRPANHPQRRLVLAAHWLAAGDLSARLEKWCTMPLKKSELIPALLAALQVGNDDFWCSHWTLRSKRLLKPQPLLGSTRVTDLAVNVILPWLWMRAVEGRNESLQQEMERRYWAWPSAQDNSVLRLARQRLLGATSPSQLPGAAVQQGLLQIVRDFCEHSNALCKDCRFPELVRQWKS
jgi:hypothetical protein